ncbi:MAG: hypothetical protein KF901_06045 [Myxococcales bacterium]|nr:hypothetical protein [Myxococcales bacterium]
MRGRLVIICCAVAFVTACGDDQDPERAAALWDRLVAERYTEWSRAPGYETPVPSRNAHGTEVILYLNDQAEEDLATPGLREWSDGALIVKDGFRRDRLWLIAAMEKRDGEWFWAEWKASGRTLYSGAPTLCTGCHAIGDDFVRGLFLPE